MKPYLSVFLSLMLSACVPLSSTSYSPGLHTIPVGSIVKLNQALTIPAEQVSAGIQYGEPTIAIDPYEPHCKFEVNTLAKKRTTLPAGDYRITRVLRYSDPFYSLQHYTNVLVASSSYAVGWLAIGASSDSRWYYTTVFRLESRTHPDIRQLVCGNMFFSGYDARDISIREFEELAGDVMTIRTAN